MVSRDSAILLTFAARGQPEGARLALKKHPTIISAILLCPSGEGRKEAAQGRGFWFLAPIISVSLFAF